MLNTILLYSHVPHSFPKIPLIKEPVYFTQYSHWQRINVKSKQPTFPLVRTVEAVTVDNLNQLGLVLFIQRADVVFDERALLDHSLRCFSNHQLDHRVVSFEYAIFFERGIE